MLDTIYTSTSGLQTFSKGLDVISNNVTNVNTVGYKANTLLYRDVHYRYMLGSEQGGVQYGAQSGAGVAADITSVLFNQGDPRSTGNGTDVAINGRGFFVIEKDGELVYSRDGQFDFNDAGYLVTRDGGYRVMGLSASGALTPINENAWRVLPSVATTEVGLFGNLSTAPGAVDNAIAPITSGVIPIYDSLGGVHNFKLTFVFDTTDINLHAWNVTVRDENGATVGTGSVRFGPDGSPALGFNTLTIAYQAAGAAAQRIVFNFGTPGSLSDVRSLSVSGGSINAASQDGRESGTLLSVSFDEKGRLAFKYSNQQTQTGPQLALADFDNVQSLQQQGRGLFLPQAGQKARIGAAGQPGFGAIIAGYVEGSNVDLSSEFTDMIVVQRGYQASSQVLTVANEMMQQLLEMNRR